MPSIAVVGGIGPLEIGIVLLIVLIIFGPKRIPELGRSLGQGFRGFKDSVTGKDKGDEDRDQLERPAPGDDADAQDRRADEPTTSGAGADTRS